MGFGLIVFGILKSSQWGLITPTAPPAINGNRDHPVRPLGGPVHRRGGLGVLRIPALGQRQERTGRKPLLSPGMLATKSQLRAGLSTLARSYLIMAGTFFVLPLYLQVVLGKDALETGIPILPISFAMVLAAVVGGRLADDRPKQDRQARARDPLVGLIGLVSSISPQLTSPVFSVSLAFRGRHRLQRFTARQRRDVLGRRFPQQRSRRAAGLGPEPRLFAGHGLDRSDPAGGADHRFPGPDPRRPGHTR